MSKFITEFTSALNSVKEKIGKTKVEDKGNITIIVKERGAEVTLERSYIITPCSYVKIISEIDEEKVIYIPVSLSYLEAINYIMQYLNIEIALYRIVTIKNNLDKIELEFRFVDGSVLKVDIDWLGHGYDETFGLIGKFNKKALIQHKSFASDSKLLNCCFKNSKANNEFDLYMYALSLKGINHSLSEEKEEALKEFEKRYNSCPYILPLDVQTRKLKLPF